MIFCKTLAPRKKHEYTFCASKEVETSNSKSQRNAALGSYCGFFASQFYAGRVAIRKDARLAVTRFEASRHPLLDVTSNALAEDLKSLSQERSMLQSFGVTAPTIAVTDGIPTTTSNDVAEYFGKDHADVLKRIRALQNQIGKRAGYFSETFNEIASPNGASRKDPAYKLTRDGFTLLAMGFTGKKALAFKLAYIDAFNALERSLHSQAAPAQQMQAPTLLNRRWIVSIVDGKEHLQPLDPDACIIKYQHLARILRDPGCVLEADALADIAKACIERLQSKISTQRYNTQLMTKIKRGRHA